MCRSRLPGRKSSRVDCGGIQDQVPGSGANSSELPQHSCPSKRCVPVSISNPILLAISTRPRTRHAAIDRSRGGHADRRRRCSGWEHRSSRRSSTPLRSHDMNVRRAQCKPPRGSDPRWHHMRLRLLALHPPPHNVLCDAVPSSRSSRRCDDEFRAPRIRATLMDLTCRRGKVMI
jgi:hypothetical protein